MLAYIIRSVRTGSLIEAHDCLSLEWATTKVETHNKLYPNDQWKMVAEEV